MASGVIYYISDTLAEIVYVVEPMELILIKTKGEIHKKTIWNCYAQHLLLPSSMHLHVHELKVFFKKLQAYVHVQCLGSLFVISVSSICLVFVHNDFFIQLFFLFNTQHRYIKPQVLSSMT